VKLPFHTGEATVYIGSLHTDILLSWTKVQHILSDLIWYLRFFCK